MTHEIKPNSDAYSYIRFSTKNQMEGDSLRRQQQLAKEYCEKNNLVLSSDSFVDLGVSAFHSLNADEDAGLGQFINACTSGAIKEGSYLLVESLDRLSRATTQTALKQLLDIMGHGIHVVTLLDDRIYHKGSDTTDLIISLTIMERAHNESLTKSKRIGAAWKNKFENVGIKKLTRTTPFWLRLNSNGTDFEVLEDKAQIVRLVFQLSIEGLGIRKICDHLLSEGIEPPMGGRAWGTTTIARLLKSRYVIGTLESEGASNQREDIENYYPAIISEEEFYLSRARIEERKIKRSGRKGKRFTNLFTNLAVCGLCKSNMIVKARPNNSYLQCSNKDKKICNNRGVNLKLLDEFIKARFLQPYNKDAVVTFTGKEVVKSDSVDVNDLINLHMSKEEQLKHLLESNGNYSSSAIKNHIIKLDSEIGDLKSKIDKAREQNAISSDKSISMHYTEAKQLVDECISNNSPEVDEAELYRKRVKLNKALKLAFGKLEITCNDSGVIIASETYCYKSSGKTVFLTPNGYIYSGGWSIIDSPK